jgi:dihydroorotate dehydrogenase electron transfer subunit
VLENALIAKDTFRIRFRLPELAMAIRPGQFLMLRVPGRLDPLLGRAFALYDTVLEDGRPTVIDIVYLVVGRMTRLLASLRPGDQVEAWGPLGNGFPSYTGVKHLAMVAGGIGQTPFLALAKQVLGQKGYGGLPPRREAEQVSLWYGVRNKNHFAGLADFTGADVPAHLATDDGSQGFHGFVTGALDQGLSDAQHSSLRLVGCGPEPMMHALAQLAQRRGLPCDLSLETPMACGVGICFSCATKVACGEGWDYRRACVDGPVFDAAKLVW